MLAVELSRLQFALTTVYHFFFVPLTLGLVWIVAILETIYSCGGDVDKFIGDSVMGFWNAPNDVPDHALLACTSALRAQARIQALNDPYAVLFGLKKRQNLPRAADHQHGARRLIRSRPARHGDPPDAGDQGPDRPVPPDQRDDHRPVRGDTLLRGRLDRGPVERRIGPGAAPHGVWARLREQLSMECRSKTLAAIIRIPIW